MSGPLQRARVLDLPEGFHRACAPAPAPAPDLLWLNEALLAQWGLEPDWFRSAEGLAALSGQPGTGLEPVAMAYAGHQFGHFVPALGDGRAHLLGEVQAADGQRHEVQTKGSGPTPWSRGGDGFATLGAALREVLVSEAMAGLGIPTTRALAVVGSGASVQREQALPGAILVRTAASHIRVGSFQYAAAHLGDDALATLADHMLEHHFAGLSGDDRYLRLLEAVIARQAELVAEWLLVGFIHGVMNTDNLAIVGETIDYGPCAFMDTFHPQKVFSSIDQMGRYAWANQPGVALWNLTRLAETLLPVLDPDADTAEELAKAALASFEPTFQMAFGKGMRAKLGLADSLEDSVLADLNERLLRAMTDGEADFTLCFQALTEVAAGQPDAAFLALFNAPGDAQSWLHDWRRARDTHKGLLTAMQRANPSVIARNHRVNAAIAAAEDSGDLAPFQRLCRVLADPYRVSPADRDLLQPPTPDQVVSRTYCGT